MSASLKKVELKNLTIMLKKLMLKLMLKKLKI
jgi:hypothetical protein